MSNMIQIGSPVNLINKTELLDWVSSFSEQPHIIKWMRSTYAKWLATEENCIQCVSLKESRSPAFRMLRQVTGMEFYVVAVPENDFVVKGLENHDLWRFNFDDDHEIDAQHMADYWATQPVKEIRCSVEEALKHVAKWNAQLQVERLAIKDVGKLTLMDAELAGGSFCALKLESKTAYQHEGKRMSHCVASYWGRKDTEIYSVRRVSNMGDDEQNLKSSLTIEVVKSVVKQVRGFKDRVAEDRTGYAAVRELAATMKWTFVPMTVTGWPRSELLPHEAVHNTVDPQTGHDYLTADDEDDDDVDVFDPMLEEEDHLVRERLPRGGHRNRRFNPEDDEFDLL